ncbi:MAG: hypothetical protein LBP20_02085, partial [Treponema sp.]|nr:hypothetical protein [Treponema sp.]
MGLTNGIPSADTILQVLGRIDHRKLEACFLSWTRGYFWERAGTGLIIAIDGKTVRGSESEERKAIHIVTGRSSAGPSAPAHPAIPALDMACAH